MFGVNETFKTISGFGLDVGVHVYMQMTTAMASDASLMPLGILSLITKPSLYENSSNFNQVLYMHNATVVISTDIGRAVVYVDASKNQIKAQVYGVSLEKMKIVPLRSTIDSFSYFGRCSNPTSQPDEMKVSNDSKTITLSHRNVDTDLTVLNKPGYLNTTLSQQGMDPSLFQSLDMWRHGQFGLIASQDSDTTVTVSTLSTQTNSSEDWNRQIHDLHVLNDTNDDKENHNNAWNAFWNRSWIHVHNSSTITERYAQTRYVNAIQSGTWVPIKFNGMVFTAHLPPGLFFCCYLFL